jgi:UDP-N-acetylglucosamine 2-epimerase (hydrolysing)|tara:strand:- start:526 stop:1659 length:1134 start_codon:yes stop_codon:yes gene_type:complete
LKIKKKIVFLTGTRADFGKLRPLIEIVNNSNEFECHIFVTGMHTLSRYDFTYREVEKRGYKNVFVFTNQNNFENTDIMLANTIKGFSNFVKKISPDMIVIHGDRLEALAGAIVGSFNNILVSHIEGGELTGTIDESIRHAVSKLSHIHFVSNEDAKKRLVQMGEIEKRIFVIGSPDIDIMMKKDLPTKEGLKKYYDMQFEKYAILIFHPVTTELDDLENQTNELVSGAIDSKRNYVIIYPNNDPGSEIILNVYKKLENNANFRIYPSLRFEYFLTLLKNADFIIGNSSSGIIEAEIYSVPTINVGTRQKNRSSNESIMNVESKKEKILDSISKVDGKEIKSSFSFGDGKSTKRFFDVILSEKIWDVSLQKQFVENYE